MTVAVDFRVKTLKDARTTHMLDVRPDQGYRRKLRRQQDCGGADDDTKLKVDIRRAMNRHDTNMEAHAAHQNSTIG